MPSPFRCVAILVAVCLAICLVGPYACAQSQPEKSDTNLTDLSLENLMNLKVTTASKRSERLADSPAAVFVIDSKDIYRYGYRTLADALRSVVGLYVSTDRCFDYLGVRGYSRPGDYNGRILLLVDGQRVNDPMYDIAPIGQDCPIDMESIDRIEVVKGPGSSLWGANALLAVINIITRTGDQIAGGRVNTETDKVFAEFGHSLGSGLDVACSVTGINSNGTKDLYFPEFDSPSTNYGIAEGVDGTRATREYLSASFKGLRLSLAQGMKDKVAPTAPYGTIFNDPGTTIREQRSLMELSYGHPAVKAHSYGLLARVYRDEYHYVGDYMYDYPPVTINRDDYLARWWGAEVRLSGYAADNLFLTYGAEYQCANHLSQKNFDVDPYAEYSNLLSTRSTQSLYMQADYDPVDHVSVVLGTRYDNYSTFGSNWSPRAAVVYSPSWRTSFKILYGNAFRAPNDYELGWQNPDLPPTQPEKIQTQELVWEQQLGGNSRLVTSLFRFDLKNIISMVSSGDTWYIANEGSATSSGFETQFETRTDSDLRAYAGLTFSRARYNDEPITNSPSCLVTAGMSIPVFSHRYFLSPQLRSVGRLMTRSGEKISAGTVLDLVIATAESSRRTNASLGVYDVFNRTIYSVGTTVLTQEKVPQGGRQLRLQLSQKF